MSYLRAEGTVNHFIECLVLAAVALPKMRDLGVTGPEGGCEDDVLDACFGGARTARSPGLHERRAACRFRHLPVIDESTRFATDRARIGPRPWRNVADASCYRSSTKRTGNEEHTARKILIVVAVVPR